MGRSWATLAGITAFAAGFLVSSCNGPVPPIPNPSVDGFATDVRDAVLAAHKQAEAAPASGSASGHLGMVLQAHALNEPAALAYQRAIRLEPREFAWRYYLALVLKQLSKPDQSLDAISGALRIRPDYAPAILLRADLLFDLGRFQESGASYEAVRGDPNSAAALYGLGRVNYAQQKTSAAEDFYRRASLAYPSYGAAYYGLAVTERSLGRAEEAAKNFELAKRYADQHPPSEDTLLKDVAELSAGAYNQLEQSDKLIEKGDWDNAARVNHEVLARDPNNLSALMNLLYIARFSDKLDGEVEDLYSKAKKLNPQIPYIHNHYGAAMLRQGKLAAAVTALRKAVELKPDYAEAHTWLGEALDRQGHSREAVEQFQSALAAEPSNRLAQVELARILLSLGRGKEAIPPLTSALQVNDSRTSMVLVMLAEAYRSTGDQARTRQYLVQALERVRKEGPPELLSEIEQELRQASR
ncbi:MAG: tetratricopeptide repeat protein [Bryobacteraceae bacterium]